MEAMRAVVLVTCVISILSGVLDALKPNARFDRQLRLLEERVQNRPWVVLTCFQPDQRKAGGAYVEVRGRVKRLDATAGAITLEDGREVPISYILEIKEEDTYEEMAENKI